MTITAILFSTVNGKKVGKAFSFHMDPKKMAKVKTEASVKKQIEAYILKNSDFRAADIKELKYNGLKEFLAEWRAQMKATSAAEEEQQLRRLRGEEPRVTPDHITSLKHDQIFVFGSNAMGQHAGGAARQAVESFGAVWGQGHGLQGQSYAIDSMSGLSALKAEVSLFAAYAAEHTNHRFLVTLIGCGIAGYTPEQIAPLFAECRLLGNVSLPQAFWDVIGKPAYNEVEYHLERFLLAQSGESPFEPSYEVALNELKAGEKHNHWIWYIFPQVKGLGHSSRSFLYGLCDTDEARAYLEHPILGTRLRECCEALLLHQGKPIEQIMGSQIDVMKLTTSMNLFNRIAPDDVFAQVLQTYFA